jgi:hypothetical protein
MRRKSLQDLPDTQVPDGFDLRTFRVGDEAGWAKLMTGAIGDCDEQSTAKEFLGDPGVQADGILFLIRSGLYIATATDKRVHQSEPRLPSHGSPWLRLSEDGD